MYEILMVAYLLVALTIIGLVLLQQGKGAGMGASFGAGASGTLFGSSGSGNFLTRTTAICATIFFVLSLLLGRIGAGTGTVEQDWDFAAPVTEVPTSNVPANSDVPN